MNQIPVSCVDCPFDSVCRTTLICSELLHAYIDNGLTLEQAKKLAAIHDT